ncbi:MAG: YidB family protein [Terriglobales bacterium]
MGLLDDLENKAVSSVTGGGSNPLASQVLQMIQQQPGGLSGLVQSFHDKGLGGVAESWIGNGQNLPISADQIQHVLGSTQVQALAAKAGISPEVASSQLAQLLPTLVDKLTPNGQVPQQGNLVEMGMNLLKSLGTPGTGAA